MTDNDVREMRVHLRPFIEYLELALENGALSDRARTHAAAAVQAFHQADEHLDILREELSDEF